MSDVKLYLGDCLDILPTLPDVDLIITDPPYPDYYREEYGYFDGILEPLKQFNCRQFIFWSAKVEFPLDYTAIHIWDKKTGAGSEYERIYERNGSSNYKVFRHYFINSTVAASFTGDIFTGHKSQKPIQLIMDILRYDNRKGIRVLDMFMGSGAIGRACYKLGYDFFGIEKSEQWFDVANRLLEQAQLQMVMPL